MRRLALGLLLGLLAGMAPAFAGWKFTATMQGGRHPFYAERLRRFGACFMAPVRRERQRYGVPLHRRLRGWHHTVDTEELGLFSQRQHHLLPHSGNCAEHRL